MMDRDNGSPQLRPYYDDQPDSGDELEPFDFGEPSDGSNNFYGAITNEDDDCKNDETFGCADPITVDNDGMAKLSERTRMLDLGDFGQSDDKAFDWPDPSTIPMPTGFMDTDRSFAAWVENTDLRPSTSVFDRNDFFMLDNDAKFDEFGFKLDQNDPYNLSKHWDKPTSSDPKPTSSNLFDLFAQNNHRQTEPQKSTQKPQVWTEEMLLKANKEEDEEKQRRQNALRMLGLSVEPNAVAQSGFEHVESSRPPTKPSSPYTMMSQFLPPNVQNQHTANYHQNFPPPPHHHPNQFNRANYPGRGNEYQRQHNMPPNFQQQRYGQQKPNFNRPYPNQHSANYHQNFPPPSNGMSPNVMNLMNVHGGPPPGLHQNQFPPGFNGSMFPPQFQQNMLAQQRAAMSSSLRDSNNSLCSRTKRPFLPSTKTLSDFAFDPYAGLMSKKEREWLIKIQLIQCMITGDPIEDDYYYSVWKERNVLKKAPAEWRVAIQPKYYNFENTYPSDRYVPPVFNGSLGKPTHSSTSYPRQIIDVHADLIEEDTESNAGGKSISQKKLRAILLQIENASLSLLECRDFLYKLTKTEMHESEARRAASVASNKIQAIIKCVATQEVLPTVMLVQKGRYLIGQLITYSDDTQSSEIMTTLVKAAPRFAHRIPADSNNQPLLRAITSRILNMDLDTFKMLRETLPILLFEPLLEFAFVQQLCLAFMIGLCGREVPPIELINGPIGNWLSDSDPKRLHALFPVFNQDAVDFDLLRLSRGLSFFPPNSIARCLGDHLTTRIKQRPA